MLSLDEINKEATRLAGKPVGVSAGFLSGEFGLTDGYLVVTFDLPDHAWDETIEVFSRRYLAPACAHLVVAMPGGM